MNKLKKFLIATVSFVVVLYCLFFVLVYAFGDLNKYVPQLQQIVKDSIGLDINVKSAKVVPTAKVELNLMIDDLTLKYPNKKDIVSIDDFSLKVPVLPIIAGDIKLSEIKIKEPKANFAINKKGEIDLVNYLTPYLEKMQNADSKTGSGLPKYFRISTKMPDIKINKYDINLYDETISQTVSMKGDTLDIVKFDIAKGLKVITKGQIGTEKQTFADYDLSVESFIPQMTETKETEKTESAFIDPFKHIIAYGFYTNIFADLKISENKDDGVNIKGDLNVKELNLKSKTTNTKGTFFDLKFNKNVIDLTSDLFLTAEQKAHIKANIKYGKKNNIDAEVKSDKLELVHFLEIAEALYNTMGIDNDFNLISVKGYISPDFTVKSDMKSLKSNGHIYLKDGQITHKAFPAKITNITSDINLSNNQIAINDTKALVNSQPISVSGKITQSADCDLTVSAKDLSIASLLEIFADKNIKNTYSISSGKLNFNATVKGKLDKLMPKATATINNLVLTDKINHFSANVPSVNLNVNTDLKTFSGNLTLGTTKIYLADLKLNTFIKNLKLNFDEKDLTINPFTVSVQDSMLTTQGTVKNYMSDMTYNILAKGNLQTATIKAFVPKEYKSMIANKGALPTNITVDGNANEINVTGSINANSANYITPIHITQLRNKPSVLSFDINTKGNDLNINKVSLDCNNTNFAKIKGQIASYMGKNPKFKNLKISTPNNFSFSIPDMANSLVTLNSDLSIAGSMNAPVILGNINISQLSVPTFKLNAKNISVNMGSSTIKASSNDVNIANSDIKFDMNASSNFSKIFTINNITVNSNNLDLGKILEVMSNMPQNSNAPGAAMPLKITSGQGNIKNFKLDAIAAQNATSPFNFSNNTLNLTNLKATAYGGNVEGTLSYDMQYLRLTTKLKGQNLDANTALTAFTGLKNQLTGNLNFNANISMIGSTWKQQMQSLKGTASFIILDGQMGSLGKFEHFLYAENLLSQSLIKTTIGSAVSKLAPKNTGKFTKLSGDIGFSNGWATLVQVSSSGPNMSLYLTGKYNLLNNNANIDIYGNISEDVANSLGPVGDLSIEKITSNIPKFGMAISKILNGYNFATSAATLKKIPQLSTGVTTGTKSFKVKINGDIESVNAVKSFMWMMSESEISAKKKELQENSILNKIQTITKPSTTTSSTSSTTSTNTTGSTEATKSTNSATTATSQTTQTKIKIPTTKEEAKEQLKKTGTTILQNQLNKNLPGFLDNIGTKNSQTTK